MGRCTSVRRPSDSANLYACDAKTGAVLPCRPSGPPRRPLRSANNRSSGGLFMSAFIRFALVAFFALLALPAFAVQPQGSAAWTDGGWINADSSLFTGPGHEYDEIGVVPGGLRIRVERCTGPWCHIHAKNLDGWMPLRDISFGQQPWT